MARQSQEERINALCAIVSSLAEHLAVLISLGIEGSGEIVEEIRQLSLMANQLQDKRVAKLVFDALTSEEGVLSNSLHNQGQQLPPDGSNG